MKKIIFCIIFSLLLLNNILADNLLDIFKNSIDKKCNGKLIVATGISDLSKGIYIAKKRALMDAYRDAINRGAGVHIEEFTQAKLTNSLSQVYSVISKRSAGIITYYEILSQDKKNNNLFETVIRACVVKNPCPRLANNGLKLFIKLLDSPKVLIIVGQKEFDEDDNKTTKKLNIDNAEIRTVETMFAQYLRSFGYDVTTSDDLFGRDIADRSVIINARKGIGGFAIQLARDAGVDIVIVGLLSYDLTKTKVYDADSYLVTVSLNAKAIMPGSGKIVGIYNRQDKAVSITGNMLTAKEKSTKKAVEKCAKCLVWDIPKYLLNEEREIEIKLCNISYMNLRKIRKLLKEQKEIIDIRANGRWKRKNKNRGDAYLVVKTSYLGVTSDDIIDLLNNLKFNFDIEEANKYFLKIKLK